ALGWRAGVRRWSWLRWAGHAGSRAPGLQAARTARDGALVRRLLRWKFAVDKGWGIDRTLWNKALLEAYRAAPTPAARAIVLDEFDDWFTLDEASALALYETDP